MKAKLLVPVIILLIAGVSFLFAQGQPGNKLLQNRKTENEVFQDILTHPQIMQNFMQQLADNPDAMRSMMGYMMQNQNARSEMMNNMFSIANQDSSIAGYMYNMMDNYPQMWNYMRSMMGNNGMLSPMGKSRTAGMSPRSMMGYRNNNQK